MSIFWLLAGIFALVGDAGLFAVLKRSGSSITDYGLLGGSVLFNVVLIYAAVTEGTILAYVIIAMALYRIASGLYNLVVSREEVVGIIQILVGVLFLYWGYQRLTAPVIPMITAGRRHWRR
jgi:hypothetical protein